MPRGFANLTPEARAEVSRKGGQTAHRRTFDDREVAAAAGRKGGGSRRKDGALVVKAGVSLTDPKPLVRITRDVNGEITHVHITEMFTSGDSATVSVGPVEPKEKP